eukprot:gnl/MRDRNA2_/MRDRNA2_95921_c0_seq1.p1 gnl/MRDRNA2_/MRDRNA2_95921_c0~~gnl/MRDRNA2_/MRDRNA2_95921_c0_seq1.p1  ORF type:complete len:233 (+),score=62.80 gnl/MRDRNA2_/MRDRNA2_95921_c0_seq1:88-786(+)
MVDAFISEHGLDDKAAKALRGASETIQAEVLEGNMSGIRNASSLVMARIKQAKASEVASCPPVDDATLEAFIVENEIDEKAANELRNEPPAVQREVLAKGDLSTANNKSSAVIGRIARAKREGFGGVGGGGKNVEDFLLKNDIDEKAARSFRGEPPHVQQAVMSQGSLDSATNKSSALMSRIGKVKKTMPGGGGGSNDMMQMMGNMMQMMMGGMMGSMMKGKGKGKGGFSPY